jgi:hypothetical protein
MTQLNLTLSQFFLTQIAANRPLVALFWGFLFLEFKFVYHSDFLFVKG